MVREQYVLFFPYLLARIYVPNNCSFDVAQNSSSNIYTMRRCYLYTMRHCYFLLSFFPHMRVYLDLIILNHNTIFHKRRSLNLHHSLFFFTSNTVIYLCNRIRVGIFESMYTVRVPELPVMLSLLCYLHASGDARCTRVHSHTMLSKV